MRIPATLINNIINIHGEKGRQWLDDLPNLLQKFVKSWNLRLRDCYPHANINYVAPAKLESGLEVVLKCGVLNPVLVAEAKALQYYNGIGAVRLLQFVEESGVMLLERVMPGNLLEEHSDEDQATVMAVELLKKLHRPLTEISGFPSLSDWFQGLEKLTRYFEGHTGPFPSHLVEKAKGISRELLNSQGAQVLLHGDLHYANILWSEQNGWLAIDPQGVIGEREFDIPFPRLEKIIDKKLLQYRLDQFIEFSGFDRQRIISWLFSKTVLAAWWTFEDSGSIDNKFIGCAEVVEKMLVPKIEASPQKYDLMVEKNRQSYNQIADTWYQEREWHIEKVVIDQAIKYIRSRGKILDVGCGSGKPIAEYLLSQGFDVYGVDISERQLHYAQQTIPKDNLWLGDIRRLQIPSMFDAIICWFVLFHVHAHEHAPILKKFYDCLNPGGILLMTMADTASPEGDYQVVDDQTIKSMMFKEEFYYSGHSLSVNLKLIKAAGFQIIAEYCDQPGCHVILAQKVDTP
jgi:streptomycin 6-kinase